MYQDDSLALASIQRGEEGLKLCVSEVETFMAGKKLKQERQHNRTIHESKEEPHSNSNSTERIKRVGCFGDRFRSIREWDNSVKGQL